MSTNHYGFDEYPTQDQIAIRRTEYPFVVPLQLGDVLDEINERARAYAKHDQPFNFIVKRALFDFAVQIQESGRKFVKVSAEEAQRTGIYFVEK